MIIKTYGIENALAQFKMQASGQWDEDLTYLNMLAVEVLNQASRDRAYQDEMRRG